MFCSQCGEKLPDNARFCLQCGMPVSETTATSSAPSSADSGLVEQAMETPQVSVVHNTEPSSVPSLQGRNTSPKHPHGSVKRKVSYTGKKKGFCQTCGAEITSADAHCPKCGAVNAARQATMTRMNDLITQNVVAAHQSSSGMVVLFAIIVGIALLIGYLFMRQL